MFYLFIFQYDQVGLVNSTNCFHKNVILILAYTKRGNVYVMNILVKFFWPRNTNTLHEIHVHEIIGPTLSWSHLTKFHKESWFHPFSSCSIISKFKFIFLISFKFQCNGKFFIIPTWKRTTEKGIFEWLYFVQ